MKIIFLDIDGVLNAEEDYYKYVDGEKVRKRQTHCNGLLGIPMKRIRILSRLVERTGAKIILTSSWKRSVEAYWKNGESSHGKYLVDRFKKCGLTVDGTTYHYERSWVDRGEGIIEYLADHPDVTDWVVLDDEYFSDYADARISDHLILTSFERGGLTEKKSRMAEKILNKGGSAE